MPDPITLTPEELEARIAEATTPLIAKRDELLGETKAAKEAARAAKAAVADMEQQLKAHKAGVSSQELDRLRTEVKTDLETQFKPVLDEAANLKAENRRLKLDSVIKAEMAKSGARADRIEALFKLTSGEYDLTDDGKPMLRERPGTPVEKYVAEELKAQYPEFFDGTGSSGGGATKSIASGVGVRVIPAGDPIVAGRNAADIASGRAILR